VTAVDDRRRMRSNRRLWSALIGGALLIVGFHRTRSDPDPAEASDFPEASAFPKSQAKPKPKKVRRAWTEIARLLYSAIGQHRVVSIAAGVTFFALLAIFPAIAALVSIYGIFSDPASIRAHLTELSSFLPGGAIEIIGDQLGRVASGGMSRLGATFLFTLALSLWSANAGMKALFDALNIVYDAPERRGLIKLNAISLAFTVGALLILLIAIATIVVLPVALNYAGLGTTGSETAGATLVNLARWPAMYAIVVLALGLIYRFGPDRDRVQWHWITWGSAIAAFVWIAASILFSWYAANFGSYNKTYGSLGAAVGFMTWIWISCMVILGGAEIDAVLERLDRGTAK
jgi:membrane protein